MVENLLSFNFDIMVNSKRLYKDVLNIMITVTLLKIVYKLLVID